MKRSDIALLLQRAQAVIHHTDYVIIGSLSILGATDTPPLAMLGSIDVDLYPADDPRRADEVGRALGLGSPFEIEFGYYADPVSPSLATLPDGWQARLIQVPLDGGVTAWFLDPNDAAISKYARCEDRDRRWLRAGLQAKILSLAVIEYRLRNETVMRDGELERARAAMDDDRSWLVRAS